VHGEDVRLRGLDVALEGVASGWCLRFVRISPYLVARMMITDENLHLIIILLNLW